MSSWLSVISTSTAQLQEAEEWWSKDGETHLARVVVPQLVVQAVRVSFLSLDLGDDVKHLRVGAAGAGASFGVWFTVWVAAAVVWNRKQSSALKFWNASPSTSTESVEKLPNRCRDSYPHRGGLSSSFWSLNTSEMSRTPPPPKKMKTKSIKMMREPSR